jgi:hypothetical protein
MNMAVVQSPISVDLPIGLVHQAAFPSQSASKSLRYHCNCSPTLGFGSELQVVVAAESVSCDSIIHFCGGLNSGENMCGVTLDKVKIGIVKNGAGVCTGEGGLVKRPTLNYTTARWNR